MRKQLLISLGIILLLVAATAGVILYGMGYRFGFLSGKPVLSGTGLLVTTSVPDGAEVFINGHLTTATNNTINLLPGSYDVKISKEGYFSWGKTIIVQKEVVSKAEALLFPLAPKLDSITSTGILSPVIDPTQTKLAYVVASQSARKNGIYILDMTDRPVITLQGNATQIADDTLGNFSQADLKWSPDGSEILATLFPNTPNQTSYLLKTSGMNQNPQDVTATIQTVQSQWEKEKQQQDTAQLAGIKTAVKKNILPHTKLLNWSPDETKLLYVASTSATLPIIIKPRLIGTNPTSEERMLKEGDLYVYDLKEDKNYKLGVTFDKNEADKMLRWFADSNHLIYVHDKKIDIMEFDATNQTTIYAGPFLDHYVFPWPSASKIVILTNLGNPDILPNLYTIGIK